MSNTSLAVAALPCMHVCVCVCLMSVFVSVSMCVSVSVFSSDCGVSLPHSDPATWLHFLPSDNNPLLVSQSRQVPATSPLSHGYSGTGQGIGVQRPTLNTQAWSVSSVGTALPSQASLHPCEVEDQPRGDPAPPCPSGQVLTPAGEAADKPGALVCTPHSTELPQGRKQGEVFSRQLQRQVHPALGKRQGLKSEIPFGVM